MTPVRVVGYRSVLSLCLHPGGLCFDGDVVGLWRLIVGFGVGFLDGCGCWADARSSIFQVVLLACLVCLCAVVMMVCASSN